MTSVTAFRLSCLCLTATVVICATTSETASAQLASQPAIVLVTDDPAIHPDPQRQHVSRVAAHEGGDAWRALAVLLSR